MAVFGQHDMRMRSEDYRNTPLYALVAAEALTLLDRNPFLADDNIHIYGASYNETIPAIEDPEAFNILVIHTMVVSDKLWEGQEEFSYGNILLMKNGFDLIVSGDNHQTIVCQDGNKYLVNAGSIMRSTYAQRGHRPCVFVYDTDSDVPLQCVYLSVQDASEVLSIDIVQKKREDKQGLEDFVLALDSPQFFEGLDFVDNVLTYMREQQMDDNVQRCVKECLYENTWNDTCCPDPSG